MQPAVDQLTIFITTYGLKVIGAIIILILGRIAAGIGRSMCRKVLQKTKTDTAIISLPQIAVSELADSSVNLVVRPWVKSGDYWDTKFDLTRKIKEAFDENGIEIPFPQVVMHSAQADG